VHLFSHDWFHQLPLVIEFFNCLLQRVEVFQNSLEYEQALSEAPQKDTFVLIRYDYSEREYSSGVHSVSHFHFGHSNSIRIPSSVVITPLLFILFVLKQVYSDLWKSLIEESNFHRVYKSSKSKCRNIGMHFFDDLDKKELYLK
jgi:hypothetical protein